MWSASKNVYLSLLSHEGPIKHQTRWANDLGINNYETLDWNTIYKNNYFCTLEVKLRSFQVKLNMRAIVTNVQIHGFGLIDTNLCSFCLVHAETLLHLFCKCHFVDCFWNDVISWISFYFKRNIQVNDFNNCLALITLKIRK